MLMRICSNAFIVSFINRLYIDSFIYVCLQNPQPVSLPRCSKPGICLLRRRYEYVLRYVFIYMHGCIWRWIYMHAFIYLYIDSLLYIHVSRTPQPASLPWCVQTLRRRYEYILLHLFIYILGCIWRWIYMHVFIYFYINSFIYIYIYIYIYIPNSPSSFSP